MAREADLAQLMEGRTPDEFIAEVRTLARNQHLRKQTELPLPAKMGSAGWAARKEWLLSPTPVYGELQEFAWAAKRALVADDQEEFSRQRDLLYLAVMTVIGDEPKKQPTVDSENLVAVIPDPDILQ